MKGLGICVPQWRDYLASKFVAGMTHENYGIAWEIDHIFPLAKADLSDPIEHAAVSFYLNTQPLSPKDNDEKGDKITADAEKLFNELCTEFKKAVAS